MRTARVDTIIEGKKMRRSILFLLILNLSGAIFFNFSFPALAVMHTEEFSGTIVSVKFGDPLKEPYFDLAKIEVVDFAGKNLLFQINGGTIIRDPMWHEAHVTYLQKGMKVKIHYVPKEGPHEAKRIYVEQEKDKNSSQ